MTRRIGHVRTVAGVAAAVAVAIGGVGAWGALRPDDGTASPGAAASAIPMSAMSVRPMPTATSDPCADPANVVVAYTDIWTSPQAVSVARATVDPQGSIDWETVRAYAASRDGMTLAQSAVREEYKPAIATFASSSTATQGFAAAAARTGVRAQDEADLSGVGPGRYVAWVTGDRAMVRGTATCDGGRHEPFKFEYSTNLEPHWAACTAQDPPDGEIGAMALIHWCPEEELSTGVRAFRDAFVEDQGEAELAAEPQDLGLE